MKKFLFLLLTMLACMSASAVEVVLDRSKWSISACNTCATGYEGSDYDGHISAAIDNNTTTFYHSDWSGSSTTDGDSGLQAFLIDMGEDISGLTAFDYMGRSNSTSGHVYTCRVYIYASGALPADVSDLANLSSDDKETVLASTNTNLGTPAFNNSGSAWSYSTNTDVKKGTFSSEKTGRYILFIQDTGSDAWLTCADFNMYQTSTSATYNVVVVGHDQGKVRYNNINYSDGATITTSTAITLDQLSAVTRTGYNTKITISGTTITVTYYIDMTPSIPENATIKVGTSTTITGIAASSANATDNSHWYILAQSRDGESPAYDNGEGSNIMRAAATVTPASLDGLFAYDNTQYLVRFINTSASGVYQIQFATGRYFATSMTTTSTSPGEYAIYNIGGTSGHFGINLGSTSGSIVDNNGAGYNLAFWSTGEVTTTGGNNDWTIYPVTFETVSSAITTITWSIKDASTGSVLGTVSREKCIQGTEYTLPQHFDYCTLSGDTTTTAGAADKTVTVTATISDLPFTASTSFANATWYWLKNRNSRYLQYEADSTKYALDALVDMSDRYQWAFIGNPITGYRIVNKAAGSTLSLYVEEAANAAHPTMQTTEQKWTLTKSENEEFTNAFGFSVDGFYLNNYANLGYLSMWSGHPTGDIGSNLVAIVPVDRVDYHVVVETEGFTANAYIEFEGNKGYHNGTVPAPYALVIDSLSAYEDPDYTYSIYQSNDSLFLNYTVKNFQAMFEENLAPYFTHHGAIYGLTDAGYNANLAEYNTAAAMDSVTGNVYRTLMSKVEKAAKVPLTSGYYRLLNGLYPTHYLQVSNSGYGVTTGKGLSTIFYINATDSTILGEEVYIKEIPTSYSATYTDEITKSGIRNQVANRATIGQAIVGDNWKTAHNLHEDAYQNVVGWYPEALASQWYILPVESIELTLSEVNGEYITTLYSPYNLTITGATPYTANDTQNPGLMTLTSTNVVNKNTGYVVKGTSATATMQITTATSTATSVLDGTNLSIATAKTESDYTMVMANKNGILGFYNYTGETLAANKAYYLSSDASVKGFLFQDEATGIEQTLTEPRQNAIYDLSGRRISKAQKGIYIQNGKKYMVK